MAQSSLWGSVNTVTNYQRGVRYISTPGHGGFVISKGFAKKNLSIAAQKRAEYYGEYLCYEQDCLACIILLELPNTRLPSTTEEDLISSLSAWNADYLIERGIPLNPKGYANYLERQEDDRLRKEKSPNLIVSAMSVDENVVKVYTADQKAHFVTAESYRVRCGLNLLSNCVLVPDYTQTSNMHY